MTLFKFKAHHKDSDEIQARFVLARNEKEAIDKMEDHCRTLWYSGIELCFSNDPAVEIENAIIII